MFKTQHLLDHKESKSSSIRDFSGLIFRTHASQTGDFCSPLLQSTLLVNKPSLLGGSNERGQRVKDGAKGTGVISAYCVLTRLCTICFSYIFSPNSQHPVEASRPILQVTERYSHCPQFGLSDPYQLQPAKFLPFTGGRSFTLCPQT